MISVLVPARNEVASLPQLVQEIRAALPGPLEVVIGDDGSTDGSADWIRRMAPAPDLRVVSLPQRSGKSAALFAALDASRGDPVVFIDADLQNDPAEIPLLLSALSRSDIACGVRVRRVATLRKRLASRVGNIVRRAVLRDSFRDSGCGFHAMRREVALALPRFRGVHRFLPVLALARGFRVSEVAVSDRARLHGQSHYGNLGRALRGLRDLVRVARLRRRLAAEERVARAVYDGVEPLVVAPPVAETTLQQKAREERSLVSRNENPLM